MNFGQENKLLGRCGKMLEKKSWKDRTVLITGITGFVGSSLASRLVSLEATVIGLVRDEVAASNFHKLGLKKVVTLVRGDLVDYSLLERTINEYSVEIVYHLGAQTIVGTANRSPLSTFKTNIEGTWNILEACRGKNHVQAVVSASSDKAYGYNKTLPYREDFPLNPEYPYDVSKACADLIARSYYQTYGVPIVVTRFANIYGHGDINFSRIVPGTIRSVFRGENPIIRSDGTLKRDYLYIDDVVDLYLLLAERINEIKGEVFNAGHNKPITALEMVEMIIRISGHNDLHPNIQGKGVSQGEINHQWLDGEKVKRLLGWEPHVTLEEGIRRTYAKYSNLKRNHNI